MLCGLSFKLPGFAFSDHCHFAGVPVEEGFVAARTTVNRQQPSSLMGKRPAWPAPIEIPEEPAAVEPPPVIAAEVFSLLLYMFSGFSGFFRLFVFFACSHYYLPVFAAVG